MGDNSSIEWTDATWNPVRGCDIVSPGCTNCYAMKVAHRFSGAGASYEGLTKLTKGGPVWTGKVRLVPEALDMPQRWKKPRRVFVNSMSDLFHEDVPKSFIDKVFAVMDQAERHTFQILTKRPERMRDYCSTILGDPLRNVWLGVSVEDQRRADERVPLLLQTPAAVRWISAEPLLGPLDLRRYLEGEEENGVAPGRPVGTCVGWTPPLDWVVVGGESGHGARPVHPNWVRGLRDQCQEAGVSFFFKQWGEWLPICEQPPAQAPRPDGLDWHAGKKSIVLQLNGEQRFDFPAGAMTCIAMGKKDAGRKLDGRTHDGYPA